MRFRVWNTSSFVILTAAYLIQPYFVIGVGTLGPYITGMQARAKKMAPAALVP
eukprot:COSAG06_NODE_1720_length_8590_cov_12.038865_5_plen_53_part_00